MRKPLTCLILAAGIIGLTGCGPLISFGDNEPETVYTLTYPTKSAKSGDGPLLLISEPGFSQGLGGRGISVRLDDNERTSIKNLRWSTGVSSLLRDYMVAGFRDLTNARAIGEDGLDVKTKCRLNSYVWEMDYLPGETRAEDQVELSIELSLINLVDGALISSELFSDMEDVDDTADGITTGFNKSLAGMMPSMGSWLNANLSACNE